MELKSPTGKRIIAVRQVIYQNSLIDLDTVVPDANGKISFKMSSDPPFGREVQTVQWDNNRVFVDTDGQHWSENELIAP